MQAHIAIKNDFFHKILVIDIETVPCIDNWDNLPESIKQHWIKKFQSSHYIQNESQDYEAAFGEKAGIFAEFGKIVCIGLGILDIKEKETYIRLKAIANDNEFELLKEFSDLIQSMDKKNKGVIFCGHNIKEFDLPYICRRLFIHNIPLPSSLDLSGKKPWEINHVDTLELWKFGDFKHYVSLDLLAHLLNVPSSKTDIDGSKVGEVYWKEKNLTRIKEYCLKDIHTTSLVFLKLKGMDINNIFPFFVN